MLFAIFVASERSRFKELIEISLPQIVELFDKVSDDYPSSATYKFDPDQGDCTVQAHSLRWEESQ